MGVEGRPCRKGRKDEKEIKWDPNQGENKVWIRPSKTATLGAKSRKKKTNFSGAARKEAAVENVL